LVFRFPVIIFKGSVTLGSVLIILCHKVPALGTSYLVL